METRRSRDRSTGSGSTVVKPPEWSHFLDDFGRSHQRWLTILETRDLQTNETALSQEMPLQSIELDTEDEKNPRINVTVFLDNKVLKHILFLPSSLVLHTSEGGSKESLEVRTLNTQTTVHFRPRNDSFPLI